MTTQDLFYQAIENNDLEEVKRLLPDVDCLHNNSQALRLAVSEGFLEITKELLPHSDCKANYSFCLTEAAESNDLEMVRLLIPYSHPLAKKSRPLQWAAVNCTEEMVNLLYPISDPVAALHVLREDNTDEECLEMLIGRLRAAREHAQLSEAVVMSSGSSKKKKI